MTCLRSLHILICLMSLYLYRYIPVSWPTWAKMYWIPSANCTEDRSMDYSFTMYNFQNKMIAICKLWQWCKARFRVVIGLAIELGQWLKFVRSLMQKRAKVDRPCIGVHFFRQPCVRIVKSLSEVGLLFKVVKNKGTMHSQFFNYRNEQPHHMCVYDCIFSIVNVSNIKMHQCNGKHTLSLINSWANLINPSMNYIWNNALTIVSQYWWQKPTVFLFISNRKHPYLESVNIAESVLHMAVNNQLGETQDLTTEMEGISKTRLFTFL